MHYSPVHVAAVELTCSPPRRVDKTLASERFDFSDIVEMVYRPSGIHSDLEHEAAGAGTSLLPPATRPLSPDETRARRQAEPPEVFLENEREPQQSVRKVSRLPKAAHEGHYPR